MRFHILLSVSMAALALSRATGQSTSAAPAPADTSAHQTGIGAYISRRELIVGGAALFATGALAPLDRPIQRSMQAEDMQDNRDLHHTATALAFSGGPGPFVAGAVLYVGGWGTSSQRVATLGVHLTEGVAIAAALNGLVKGMSGRELPNARSSRPGDFSFGRGFHDGNGPFVSFPSGHTAASFATAAVITDEVASWDSSSSAFIGPVAYSTATLVALSRLYQNVHWASDLPIGAAIGVLSGKTLVKWMHRHPTNWIDRHLVGVTVAPAGHRMAFGASLPLSPGVP